MKEKDKAVFEGFEGIDGVKPVDPKELRDFEYEMTQNVIPDIAQAVEERRLLAAESRYREFEVLKKKRL